MCKQIDHFPEETDYEADPSEYFLREYLVHIFCFILEVTTGRKKKEKEESHQVLPPHVLLTFYSEYF